MSFVPDSAYSCQVPKNPHCQVSKTHHANGHASDAEVTASRKNKTFMSVKVPTLTANYFHAHSANIRIGLIALSLGYSNPLHTNTNTERERCLLEPLCIISICETRFFSLLDELVKLVVTFLRVRILLVVRTFPIIPEPFRLKGRDTEHTPMYEDADFSLVVPRRQRPSI